MERKIQKIVVLTTESAKIKSVDKSYCLRACDPNKGVGKFEVEYIAEFIV